MYTNIKFNNEFETHIFYLFINIGNTIKFLQGGFANEICCMLTDLVCHNFVVIVCYES